MQTFAIALACDNQFLPQLSTTIKSICLHNRAIHFYILHTDIPSEWFVMMTQKLQQHQCQISSVYVSNHSIKNYQTHTHINYATYLRYFIPAYIPDDVVLYLDCDTVVTGDVTHLFQLNFQNKLVAAVLEYRTTAIFNAGVMLINNRLWKQQDIFTRLLHTTETLPELVAQNGDQSVLNHVIADEWIALPETYNYTVGFDLGKQTIQFSYPFEDLEAHLPRIVHYVTQDKPWLQVSSSRLRELWWFYYQLEWSDLDKQTHYQKYCLSTSHKQLLILTNSDELEQIDYLIQHLPDYHFHIMAFTRMSDKLQRLYCHQNVSLYPNIVTYTVESVLKTCTAYLDINHGDCAFDIVNKARLFNKAIFTFDNTTHQEHAQFIFSHTQPQQMVDAIRAYQ